LVAAGPAQRPQVDHSEEIPPESKQNFPCEICKIPKITGKKNYLQHINGPKHISQVNILEKRIEDTSRPGSQNLMCADRNEQLPMEPRKYYQCEACKIYRMASEKQYIEHINGKKHKEQTKILEERTNEQKEEQVGGTADEVALENGRRIADLSIQ